MENRDFRSLDERTQAELRRLALKKIDDGWDVHAVGELVEVHWMTVYEWKKRRAELEENEYRGLKRGRREYEQRYLTREQEGQIKTIILEKIPSDVQLGSSLWDRKAIQKLIEQYGGKEIALETVSKYTKRWGLTPQRPKKYASEQNDEKIQEWLKETFPEIQKRAREEGAEIHWSDETGISLSTFYARGYAETGKTPIVRLPAKKLSIAMISSITNQGKLRFMLYTGALNAPLFLIFLKRLVKNTTGRKIFLIVDNLSVHKAKIIKDWQKQNQEKLELFFPPELCPTI